tara:strand:- start:1249 stop:1500 length:252 start_codon:yes stop_codon:yes gene_type:complete
MCLQRTWIMNDEDWAYELFLEKASEEEISRFADQKCNHCLGRGLCENLLDRKSGYTELHVCPCILENKEEDIKEYLGIRSKNE